MKIILLLLISFASFGQKIIYVGGTGASDNNTGTTAQPFVTIQKAASVAVAGDIVKIRSGTYRETIVPTNSGTATNPIRYEPDLNSIVIISGLNVMDNSGWTVHSGNIYKKSITLPVNGFNTSTTRIENNTTIFANQIFRNGEMQFEARWPKINVFADLFDRSKFRQRANMVIWEPTYLQDNGLPLPSGQLSGATLVSNGWFITEARTVTHAGNQLTHAGIWDNTTTGKWSRQRYYLTGKLALLTQAKEWHYENGTLYFWQNGGGVPSGTIEFKARNWGFDIRGKSNIIFTGLQFIGCDPVVGNASSVNTVIDNIKATYMNHHVRHDVGEWQGVGMSKIFGIKLIGANSIIKNSELAYSGSSGVWLGPNGRAENNLMHDMGYVGYWANPISLWDRDGGQVITRNTIYRTGRSCFDFGYNWNGQHLNVEVSYNDFSQWGLVSQDVGATYAWGQCNLTGLNYHHNWVHDTGAPDGPERGANVAIYFDQSTGPGTIHHNVVWNAGAADMYHETMNETRGSGAQMNIYNNTFANIGGVYPRSYITYRASPLDNQRNNIYRSQLIFAAGSAGNVANSLMPATNPLFVGAGGGGLAYRVQAASPAVNKGIVIAGITDGSIGVPDIGAYEVGGVEWVPGFKGVIVPPIEPPIEPPVVVTTPRKDSTFVLNGSYTMKSSAPTPVTISFGGARLKETVNDTDSRITYSAGWTKQAGQLWTAKFTGGNWSQTYVVNASATMTFTGKKVSVTAEFRENHGVAKIEVKRGTTVVDTKTVDMYAPTKLNEPSAIYTSEILPQGVYTVTVSLNSITAGRDSFVLDTFLIYE